MTSVRRRNRKESSPRRAPRWPPARRTVDAPVVGVESVERRTDVTSFGETGLFVELHPIAQATQVADDGHRPRRQHDSVALSLRQRDARVLLPDQNRRGPRKRDEERDAQQRNPSDERSVEATILQRRE